MRRSFLSSPLSWPALLASLGLLAGCDLGPDYRRPTLEVPASFRATPATAATAWPAPGWWQGFGSPDLDRLITEAKAQNFDIAAAIARVRQADAQVQIAGSPLLPGITAQGDTSWNRTSTSGGGRGATGIVLGTGVGPGGSVVTSGSNRVSEVRQHSLAATVSYEVDFWGRNRAALEAAENNALFSRFDQQTVALTVESAVALTYFTALAYYDRLTIAERNLALTQDTLKAIQGRFAVGTASLLDVSQQEALVAGERAIIPTLRSFLEQEVIGLGILVGRPPERVTISPASLDKLRIPAPVPGLPSAVLARRPDVAAAEATLAAANANIKVARAAFFPTVTLTASGGWQSLAFSTLFSPASQVASLAGSVVQTVFDNGLLAGQLGLAKGRYEELLADYRKTVVQAFTDVENAVTALRYAARQEALEHEAVATAQRAVDIAHAQLLAGLVDVTTLLVTEQTLFTDEDTLAQARLTRFQALVNLYRALGGGWVLKARTYT